METLRQRSRRDALLAARPDQPGQRRQPRDRVGIRQPRFLGRQGRDANAVRLRGNSADDRRDPLRSNPLGPRAGARRWNRKTPLGVRSGARQAEAVQPVHQPWDQLLGATRERTPGTRWPDGARLLDRPADGPAGPGLRREGSIGRSPGHAGRWRGRAVRADVSDSAVRGYPRHWRPRLRRASPRTERGRPWL